MGYHLVCPNHAEFLTQPVFSMKYRPIFQNKADEPPKLSRRSTEKTNRTHSTPPVYSSFNCLPIRACTASRGANPSYKTLYMVPVTGMSTPRRCASRCTACVVLTPSATMHMDEAMSSRLSPAPRRSPT